MHAAVLTRTAHRAVVERDAVRVARLASAAARAVAAAEARAAARSLGAVRPAGLALVVELERGYGRRTQRAAVRSHAAETGAVVSTACGGQPAPCRRGDCALAAAEEAVHVVVCAAARPLPPAVLRADPRAAQALLETRLALMRHLGGAARRVLVLLRKVLPVRTMLPVYLRPLVP